MRIYSKQSGFSAVELLITLFIAAAFMISGFQLYALVIKDGGEASTQARASNAATEYLQRFKSSATNPCTVQTPYDSSATVSGLSNVTVTVSITCPYDSTTSISKVAVSLKYGTPQQIISNATFVTLQGIVTNGLVLDLDAGITASYPGTGTTWTDLSGNGNNGTLNSTGVTYTTSNGGALVFDGSSGYVNTSSISLIGVGTGGFTYSFWAKWNNISGYQAPIDCGYSANKGILVENDAGTKVRIYIGTTFAGLWDWVLTTNTWYNFVVKRDGTLLSIFVNGTPLGNPVTNSTSVLANNCVIGKYTGGEWFNGSISNVSIYNRALSSNEITQNFNALKSRYGL